MVVLWVFRCILMQRVYYSWDGVSGCGFFFVIINAHNIQSVMYINLSESTTCFRSVYTHLLLYLSTYILVGIR